MICWQFSSLPYCYFSCIFIEFWKTHSSCSSFSLTFPGVALILVGTVSCYEKMQSIAIASLLFFILLSVSCNRNSLGFILGSSTLAITILVAAMKVPSTTMSTMSKWTQKKYNSHQFAGFTHLMNHNLP